MVSLQRGLAVDDIYFLLAGDEGKPSVEVIILVCTGAAATLLWLMLILFIRKLRKVRRDATTTTLFRKACEHSGRCGMFKCHVIFLLRFLFPVFGQRMRLTIASCVIHLNGRTNLSFLTVYDFHISFNE